MPGVGCQQELVGLVGPRVWFEINWIPAVVAISLLCSCVAPVLVGMCEQGCLHLV